MFVNADYAYLQMCRLFGIWERIADRKDSGMKKSASPKDGKSGRQEMSKNEAAQKSSSFGLPDFCRLSDYKGL
jgi:hypothetical protein